MDSRIITQRSKINSIYAVTLASLAWIAIGWQFFITDLSTINFFSYFTTLCNLLIAASLSISALLPDTRIGKYFSNLSVQTAIAIYIFIVSLVYNLVLRGIWALTGIQWILDNVVHVVVPLLYILYWIFFRSKGTLRWQDGFYWAIFPLLYLTYSLVRGSIIHWYPYPFLNAIKFGYEKVFLNMGMMMAIFITTGLILTMLTRVVKKEYLP